MAVPKKRTSNAAKGQRRSHQALAPVMARACTNCGQLVLPHHACAKCGYYAGKPAVKV